MDPTSSPKSTTLTLRASDDLNQHSRPPSASRRSNCDIDIEDAAAGAVEDLDEKNRVRAMEDKEVLDWATDPDNPRNWPNGQKWRMAGMSTIYQSRLLMMVYLIS